MFDRASSCQEEGVNRSLENPHGQPVLRRFLEIRKVGRILVSSIANTWFFYCHMNCSSFLRNFSKLGLEHNLFKNVCKGPAFFVKSANLN